MPYDDFGNEIPSHANKKTSLLTFGDIGGVGQLVYHGIRFADYSLEYDANDALIAVPVASTETPPNLEQREDLDGNAILTGLCDLARKIDSFETEESYVDLIVDWCKENMHPYQIDPMHLLLTEGADLSPELLYDMAARDGVFPIGEFMKDLGKLYYAARLKMALDGVFIAEEDDAYNLYTVGRFFEAPAVFEKYKQNSIEIPKEVLNGKDDGLVAEMQRVREYEDSHPQELPPEGEFASEPYDEYEELCAKLIDLFPDFRLRLKKHPDGRIILSAEVDSVFDIAWYALAHLITEETAPREKGKRSERILATCTNCGRFFLRKNSRNHYCDRVECQKARNAQNQRDFRKRQLSINKHANE